MSPDVPPDHEVLAGLDRILASPGFTRNVRLSRFLRFIVERHLEHRDHELKESVVALEVFDRRPDYDPKLDSIVRTEAGRLRSRLVEYYAGPGGDDPILIDLPRGGYVPVVRRRTAGLAAAVVPRPHRRLAVAAALLGLVAAAVAAFLGFGRAETPIGIAVLPLENLSADPSDAYLADGLTDEIIRNLSAVEGLSVRSRTSALAFRERPVRASEVGRQLNADYLVEGSVLRDGERLRLTARLIRVADDEPVWSDRYDRDLADVFQVQGDLARGIANQLRLSLGQGRWPYETSTEAYDLYLRARAAEVERSILGRLESIDILEQAITLDPAFAPAYAELGAAYALRSAQYALPHPDEELHRMRVMALRAVELDPLLAYGHAALALTYARDADWARAEASFRQAVALDPQQSRVRVDFAMWFLHVVGRNDEALAELGAALESDPLSADVHLALAWVLLALDRYDEADEHCHALPEGHTLRSQCLGRVRLAKGAFAEAIQAFSDDLFVAVSGQSRGFLGHALARAGRTDEARRMLADATTPNEQVLILAGLGEVDLTLEALDGMSVVGPQRIGRYLNSPELRVVRNDSRVKALRQRVRLPS